MSLSFVNETPVPAALTLQSLPLLCTPHRPTQECFETKVTK